MLIYPPDTIVRNKITGEFAKIKKRCWCGGHNTPLHYEVFREDKKGELVISVYDHEEIEFEWPPKEVFEQPVLAQ